MANYLAQRIIDGRFTYKQVMEQRPYLKPDMDQYLKSNNREDLIEQQ